MTEPAIPLKIAVIGDSSRDKTSLLLKYMSPKSPEGYTPTVFDNTSLDIAVGNRNVHLTLLDTAGQQQYERLRCLVYTHIDVALILFSVSDEQSFENACNKWYQEVKSYCPKSLKIFVGNKIEKRKIFNQNAIMSKQQARDFILSRFDCKYMECSSETGKGVDKVFRRAIRMGLQHKIYLQQKAENQRNSCSLM